MNDRTNVPPLGVGHFTFLDLPPSALIRLAARTGFSFVGMRLHPVVPGGVVYRLPPGSREMRETKAAMEGEGVTVYDVETVVIDPTFDPETLMPALTTAAELGARRLNICGDDADRGRLVARFARLCELAATQGMGVDVECMKWREIDSLSKVVEVIDASGKENAGVLIDALHLARCGGTPADVVALPARLVRSAQLCDAPALPPERTEAIIAEARSARLPPGQGGLPLGELIAALPSATAISIELPMQSDLAPEPRARMMFDATMSLFRRHQPGSGRLSGRTP